MDFGKAGKRVSRTGWNGKSQYIELAACVSYKNAAGEIINVNGYARKVTEAYGRVGNTAKKLF